MQTEAFDGANTQPIFMGFKYMPDGTIKYLSTHGADGVGYGDMERASEYTSKEQIVAVDPDAGVYCRINERVSIYTTYDCDNAQTYLQKNQGLLFEAMEQVMVTMSNHDRREIERLEAPQELWLPEPDEFSIFERVVIEYPDNQTNDGNPMGAGAIVTECLLFADGHMIAHTEQIVKHDASRYHCALQSISRDGNSY